MKTKVFLFTVIFAFTSILLTSCGEGAGTGTGGSSAISTVINVANAAQWNNAINTINSGSNDKEYTLNIMSDFSIPGTTVVTFKSYYIKVLIKGNKTISLSSPGSILHTQGGQDIIIEDTKLKGLSNNNEPVVKVMTMVGSGTGRFTMQGSASVLGNTTPNFGGGVVVHIGGTFIMKDNSSVSGNTSTYYGGGGVYVQHNQSDFIMQDNATVSGNTASGNSCGGGVYVNGNFTMKDNASVQGNTADSTNRGGGGVYVDFPGDFYMEGGTVYCNEAAAGLRNTAADGAAIYKSGGTAQYGIAYPYTALTTTNNTIKIVNGELQ